MRQFLLAVAVAVLTLEASGVPQFLLPEPCAPLESTRDEQDCPPTCVLCGCCAQPLLPLNVPADTAVPRVLSERVTIVPAVIDDPAVRDIAHVPKPHLA